MTATTRNRNEKTNVVYIEAWLASRDYNVTSRIDYARSVALRERMDRLTGRKDPERTKRNAVVKGQYHLD